ncbi:MAG: hypothetical protein R3C28_17580 [Pirellulaceae bacterium]
MSIIAQLALTSWFAVAVIVFSEFRGSRGIVICMVLGWLTLPCAELNVPVLPNISKAAVTALGTMLAVIILEPRMFLRLRPHWIDIPIIVYCLCGIPTALSNGLGVREGVSCVIEAVYLWGFPYLLGRAACRSLADIRFIALSIVVGAIGYVAPCFVEMRLSPHLHVWLYGFRPLNWNAEKLGGYRPSVFMYDGLELGFWMAVAAMSAYWLWRAQAIKKIWVMPMSFWVVVLMVTSVLCRSTGATLLTIGGIIVLEMTRRFRSSWPFVMLTMTVFVYMGLRINDVPFDFTSQLAAKFSAERAQSLQFRLDNEDILIDKAMQRPLLGWGRFGRNRVYNEEGRDISITDGLWVLLLGIFGFVGLGAFFGAFLIPSVALIVRLRKLRIPSAFAGAPQVIAMIMILYMLDSLLNGMENVVYPLCAGALSSLMTVSSARIRREVIDSQSPAIGKPQKRQIRKLSPGHIIELTRPSTLVS